MTNIAFLENELQKINEKIKKLLVEKNILENLIKKANEENDETSAIKFTHKNTQAEYYMSIIKRILKDTELLGKDTKSLHHVIEVVTGTSLNYSTFRSYLNRMKKNGEIYKNKQKKWHLRNKSSTEPTADDLRRIG